MALPPTRESRVYSLLPGCSEATEPTSVQCCWRRRVLRTDVRGLSPGRGLGKRGDGERDSIVNGLGGSVVDERRTSVEGYPGNGSVLSGRIRAAKLPSTSSCTACMCCTLSLRRAHLGRRIFLHF